MSNALVVSPSRSLDLPLGALFSPKELVVGPSTTKAEYQRLVSGLAKIDDAEKIWICDALLWSMNKFGIVDGVELSHAATGYTKGTCKKLAHIASRFTPEHRPDGFTRAHFKALLPFPQEWLNSWLPTVSNRKLSASGVRQLAIEQFGSDPSRRPVKKTRNVSISATLYAALRELNQTQPSALVEAILTAWLSAPPEEQSACLAVAAESKKEAKNEHQREKRAKDAEKIAEKNAARDAREAEALKAKEEKKEFYAAERLKREAECVARKAEKIAAREAAKRSRHCDDVALYAESLGKEVRWPTKEEADEVAVKFSAARGYLIESFLCDKCSQWHVQRAVGTIIGDDQASDHAENYAERVPPREVVLDDSFI